MLLCAFAVASDNRSHALTIPVVLDGDETRGRLCLFVNLGLCSRKLRSTQPDSDGLHAFPSDDKPALAG